GDAGNARRILRELILQSLAQFGGRARASAVLRAVRSAAEPIVPAEWRRPHPPYRSRIELYTAFERATLRSAGLLDASERGYWVLTKSGKVQADKLMRARRNGKAMPNMPVEQVFW